MPWRIATSWTTELHLTAAIDAYEKLMAELGAQPSLLILHCSVAYEADQVLSAFHDLTPNVPIHGGTSCLGVMTQAGVHIQSGGGFGLLGLHDPDGSYGVGVSFIDDNPKDAARKATESALEHAYRCGEVPSLVLMTASPGCEEELISGIEAVVGQGVPIAGGSSADNNASGEWKQFANGKPYKNAIVVTVLFPSSEIMFAFHSGYEPTGLSGLVTKAKKRRLMEIDGRPAALVYNEWIDGRISDQIKFGGCIMTQTTLHPLGSIVGQIGAIPYFKLSHPEKVNSDGTIDFFSNISQGDKLVLMRGTAESLVSRAGRVALSALETNNATPSDVEGALIIYCAGCMLTVKNRLDDVVDGLRKALPDTPFLGVFTFGEQGCFLGGQNRHGNLMISVLLFTKKGATALNLLN